MDRFRRAAKRIPFAVDAYRRWRDGRWKTVPPRLTPYGFLLTGHAEMMAGRFEPEETVLVQRLLGRCDRFVNIGANVGYYVCHAMVAGKPVVAVEPHRRNLDYLLTNVSANARRADVEIYPVALADAADVLSLHGAGTAASLIPGWARASTRGRQLTPVLTLDSLLEGRFAGEQLLVLIDVEGVEDRVLAGAPGVLARSPRPIFLVEISFGEHLERPNPKLLATFEHFWSRGYVTCTATADPQAVSRAEIAAMAEGAANIFGTQNFLFFDPELDIVSVVRRP
ncbi:MAG: FkbM family methyltransferase [Sphingomonadaceae bacterium]